MQKYWKWGLDHTFIWSWQSFAERRETCGGRISFSKVKPSISASLLEGLLCVLYWLMLYEFSLIIFIFPLILSRILNIYTKLYGENDGRVGMAMCSLAHVKCAMGKFLLQKVHVLWCHANTWAFLSINHRLSYCLCFINDWYIPKTVLIAPDF